MESNGRTGIDDVAKCLRVRSLFPDIFGLQFQAAPQLLGLFKSSRIDDGDGGLREKNKGLPFGKPLLVGLTSRCFFGSFTPS